jgi:choline dehydrogenase-like flavoprotein
MSTNKEINPTECDILIIGTGIGGAMAAYNLADTGAKIVMLEKGYWKYEDNWLRNGGEDEEFAFKTTLNRKADPDDKNYCMMSFDKGETFQRHKIGSTINAVGGYSVVYAACFWRFRKEDFKKSVYTDKYKELEVINKKNGIDFPTVDLSDWSINNYYDDLEPYYCQAEKIMGVSGIWEADPMTKTKQLQFDYEPLNISENNFLPPLPLNMSNEIFKSAAENLKWKPFPIPLGINTVFNNNNGMRPCVQCNFCSGYPCFWHAKNSVDETVLESLDKKTNVGVITGATVRKITHVNNKCEGVIYSFNDNPNELKHLNAKVIVLAAGAIQSPRLLLLSDREREIYKSKALGKYLMFHGDEKKGVFLKSHPEMKDSIHYLAKKLAILDFYTSASSNDLKEFPYVNHFSLQAGSKAHVIDFAKSVNPELGRDVNVYDPEKFKEDYKSYYEMQTIVEDLPQPSNRVELDFENLDGFGDPVAKIIHKYHPLDNEATKKALATIKTLLEKTGGVYKDIKARGTPNGSHLMGTLRIGQTPENAFLSSDCQSFDVSNLFVADGSAFTTSAGLNPGLTIAAIGLKVGYYIKNHLSSFNIHPSNQYNGS